ncbi:alpha/beta hydrolase [Massilia glaciei]|uniref:Alpha/beta hydrolase n=1 Tax=Massilia glaciei TaxID=1524097 RepID=A0A2U2HPB1_9BURK|nr:alpha/beta hydrolase [Massilia glaciei]PWF49333.1 alpha/beta hydrolase [Massilia glaciei]
MLFSKESFVSAVGACALSATAFAADTPPPLIDGAAYTQAQRMVEIEPGRRLNLYCVGTGSPTVVFEAGLADAINVWGLVQPAISQQTRTCAYERAGVAFSDAGTRASTSQNIVDDLHRLLVAAEIKPPYLLVGHSSGGLSARLFATTFPLDVVGMVLVDPTVEDQAEAYRALDSKKRDARQWDLDTVESGLQEARACVAAAKAGFVADSAMLKKCISAPYPAQLSEAVKAANLKFEMTPAHQQAALSENEHVFRASADQVRAARRSYGTLPLVVLTRSPSTPRNPLTAEEQAVKAVRDQVVVTLHENVAKLSARGVHEIVPGAGHYIQLEKPMAVIDAIKRVLAISAEEPRRGLAKPLDGKR